MESPDVLAQLEAWFEAATDGEWEHQHGISIATLDNPGWSLKIDLTATVLADRAFDRYERHASDRDWIVAWREAHSFNAACGPLNLTDAVRLFLRGQCRFRVCAARPDAGRPRHLFLGGPGRAVKELRAALAPSRVLALGLLLKDDMPARARESFPQIGGRVYETEDDLRGVLLAVGFTSSSSGQSPTPLRWAGFRWGLPSRHVGLAPRG